MAGLVRWQKLLFEIVSPRTAQLMQSTKQRDERGKEKEEEKKITR